MNKSYLTKHLARRGVQVPQSQPIPGREADMEPNNAGGYSFTLDKWSRLNRFLILGTEGGTYYVDERELTKQNFKVLEECIADDGIRTLDAAVAIYEGGRAAKVDTPLFAIAAVAALSANGSEARIRALDFVKHIRTGTHLFQWNEYYRSFRGVGKLFRKAVSNWYSARSAPNLAYQMAKYQQRNGWSHKDVLALCHWNPESISPEHKALGKWAKDGTTQGCPPIITAMESLRRQEFSEQAVIDAITTYGLTREMLPTEVLNSVGVWSALLEKMPLHATVRNLGKMTEVGLITPFNTPQRIITSLTEQEYIRRSRLHPLAILTASRTYAQGHGMKGSLKWTPARQVIEALDTAMNLSFANVAPTNKNIVVGVDISGSMTAPVGGLEYLTCGQVAMVLALIYMKIEPNAHVMAFDTAASHLSLSASSTIQQAIATARHEGGTDCAVPIAYAVNQGWNQVDAFVILTDNETWAGNAHAQTLVEQYRRRTGRPTKFVVVSMAANQSNITDPKDPLALQVVGMDTMAPQLINEFIGGQL